MATDDTPTTQLGSVDSPPPAAKKPRRKGRGVFIALVIIVVLLGIAWIVGEFVARNFAERFVHDKVVAALELPASTDVAVTIGPGSLLAQALTGGIDSVTIGVDDYEVNDIAGDLRIAMTEIPLDQNAPLDTMRVTYTIPESEVAALGSYVSGAENAEIELLDDRIAISSEIELFGIGIPVGAEVAPIVVDGQVGFEPQTISVNGNELSIEELNNSPFAGLSQSVLQSRTFCVASSLPQALTVTDIVVSPERVTLTLEGDGVALGSKEFSKLGSCP